jgi:hypothetical protein
VWRVRNKLTWNNSAWLYILILFIYASPFIAGQFVAGHMMFYRYLILKQYWFTSWTGMPYVQGGLIALAIISFGLFLIRLKRIKGMHLKTNINLLTIFVALYITNIDPFSQQTYFFIFISVLINVGLSFLLLLLPVSKK